MPDPRTFQPDKVMPLRKDEALVHRLHYCRKMLWIHGFITDAQERKIRKKLPLEVRTK